MAKAKASAKLEDVKRCKVEVRHDFTTDEWKEKTNELTVKMKDVELKEEAVKAATATAKAQIKALKSMVNDIANQLRNGYEMQTVDATVEFNRKKGTKSYFWFVPGKPEHKKHIRDDAMTEDDFETLPGIDNGEAQPPGGSGELAAAALEDKMKENQVEPASGGEERKLL